MRSSGRTSPRTTAKIDAIYFCPHHPDEGCPCRKPRIGLIQQATQDFDIDIAGSFVIGDSEHDVEMGRTGRMPDVPGQGRTGLQSGSGKDP